ncbi:MAG: tRNA lysidine(34) synthetase TilS [Acidiphilium sp.]
MTRPLPCRDLADRFAAAMAALGPFGLRPRLAVGVSGGADSTALALLADAWARAHGGSILALIADHGLRAESAEEAAATARRLGARRIETTCLTLNVAPGSALQARARDARHAALAEAARLAGIVHLLLGHHAADQAELRAMRAARAPRGAAGMAAWAARHDVVLLRPLLGIAPGDLREFLGTQLVAWIEDPSNLDPRFERARLRAGGVALPAAIGPVEMPQAENVAWLARYATIHPEAYALVRADTMPEDALGALLRAIGGATYAPARHIVGRLAAALKPATLGGVRILAAGRLGPGWLFVREPAACAPPIAPRAGAVWDGRFRIRSSSPGADRLGALADHAYGIGRPRRLPSAILRGLPAFFCNETLLAVPHLGLGPACQLDFAPPGPVVAAFVPASHAMHHCVAHRDAG